MHPVGQNTVEPLRTGLSLESLSRNYDNLFSLASSLYNKPKTKTYTLYTPKPGEICFCAEGFIKTNEGRKLDRKIKNIEKDLHALKKKTPQLAKGPYKEHLKQKSKKKETTLRVLENKRKESRAIEESDSRNLFVAHNGLHPAHATCILEWLKKKEEESQASNCLYREETSCGNLIGRCYVCKDKVDVHSLLELYNQQQIPLEKRKTFSFEPLKTFNNQNLINLISQKKAKLLYQGLLIASLATLAGIIHLNVEDNPILAAQIGLTNRYFFVTITKIILVATQNLWGTLSNKESPKILTFFTGVFVGVLIMALETPEIKLTELEKNAISLGILAIGILSNIGIAHIEAEEGHIPRTKSVINLTTTIALVAGVTTLALTAFKHPQEVIFPIGSSLLIEAFESTS